MPSPICSVMTNKELFYFTGRCLTLEEHPEFREKIIQLIESDSINWQNFVSLCSNHLILPVIYLKFQSHDILSHLPEELSEFLKEIYHLNLSRNIQILKQLDEITNILNENEISPIYLKGAGNLLDNLYGDQGERIMGDIDLLVTEEDYLRAANILEIDGYTMTVESYIDIQSLKHYPRLSKTGVPASVEIHRLPVPPQYIKWYNTEIINKEKRAINKDASCFVLSDNHKVIHNFIHSQLSNKGDAYGIVSFRDIYDLYLLSKRISISQTISHIQYKRKAIAYFVFAGNALGLPKWFYQDEPISARMFCLKHDLYLQSPAFYYTNRTLRFMTDRIFSGYIGQFIKSFYLKSMRRSLFNRLTNPRWYKNHLNFYIGFFSHNK